MKSPTVGLEWRDRLWLGGFVLVVRARTAGVRSTPSAPTAAGHGVAGAPVALAKGGKAAQPTAGMDAAAFGAGDLVVGLAHSAALLELLLAVRATILIDWHLLSPMVSLSHFRLASQAWSD